MRVSLKKCLTITCVTIITIITWTLLFNSNTNERFTHTCNLPEKYQDELHEFTYSVHKILKTLRLTHFLCYGSLWGEIRLSRLLPWEDKAVMCLLNEEVSTKDELSIARIFIKNGFHLSYDATQGQYIVTKLNDEGKMKVLLIVFEIDKVVNMYRRIGWMRRVLPPDCDAMESLECFPPRLIVPPLPLKEFGRKLLPVPREGIELQKYHYRDNWWKEVAIKNC